MIDPQAKYVFMDNVYQLPVFPSLGFLSESY